MTQNTKKKSTSQLNNHTFIEINLDRKYINVNINVLFVFSSMQQNQT